MTDSNLQTSLGDDAMSALVTCLVRSLVEDREHFTVNIVAAQTYSTVEVCASESVVAQLVGVKGQMARSLRTVVAGASKKIGRTYGIDLISSPLG